MDEIRDELLRGEDKLLQRILEAWEYRYAGHLQDLTKKFCEEVTNSENEHEADDSSNEAREVLRDAVDLKARVKAELDLLQELRSEIEDSESAFEWKARCERLDKENLQLREKVEDLKEQVADLERTRQSKEFEISNQRRYYDNRVEDLERQLRRLSAVQPPPPPPHASQATPAMERVRHYTALTVISDDEEDELLSPAGPPPPAPARSLPATPLSASSPKARPPSSPAPAADSVPAGEHRRVVEELRAARDELARLRADAEARPPPELTASLERLKAELCLVDDASQTDDPTATPRAVRAMPAARRLFSDEMSFSGLLGEPEAAPADRSQADAEASGPLFPLETLAGVIVEASLNNAVSTMRQVEEAVARERSGLGCDDSNRVAEEMEERQRLLRDKFAACRGRLHQRLRKDSALRREIEEFEGLLGLSADQSSEDCSVSAEHMEAETQTVCQACTRLQEEASEAEAKRVELQAHMAQLEKERAELRKAADGAKKREAELEQHIAKLRNLSVKDNEEIDSLIGELDTLRQLLDKKQEDFRREKEQELQAIMRENYKNQNRISDKHEEELVRLRREHAQAIDMLDQKYQDEFVDLERHHTEEMLALKKDLEERFSREVSRIMENNALEVASLRERLQEARNAAESMDRPAPDTTDSVVQQNEQIAVLLVNELIQYCSALEIKLNEVCMEEDLKESGKSNISQRLPSFPVRCSSELQPALSQSLDALTALVNRLLAAHKATHQRADAQRRRIEALEQQLTHSSAHADQESREADDLRKTLQDQGRELQQAEALIRTYAEKEGELAGRVAELQSANSRMTGELEATKTELEDYRNKESAIDEERSQLQSVRDLLSSSMNDSSRALFEANQSLLDEKSQLESEFGRRFEQLQARRTELEGQVEALELEQERREDSYKARVDDLEAQIDAMRKQTRADAKFLEQQTRERETERDKFQDELEQLQRRLRDLVRENSSLRDQLASAAPPGSPVSPSPSAIPAINGLSANEIDELREQLEEEQSTAEQLREQVDELLAENARLQVDLLQRRGSSSPEGSDDEGLDDRASADSLEAEQVLRPTRRQPAAAAPRPGRQGAEPVEEAPRIRMMRELEVKLARRRADAAEARLEEADADLARMRHVHEELQNDKTELQHQVCAQLSQLSALRQEVDAKRQLQPSGPSSAVAEAASQAAAQAEERAQQLEAELSRVRELLESRSGEAERLERAIEQVLEEKEQLASDNASIRVRAAQAEAASGELEAAAMSEFTQRLLAEKNDEIDAMQARLARLEEASLTDGRSLEDAQAAANDAKARLDQQDALLTRASSDADAVRQKMAAMVKERPAGLLVTGQGDGPSPGASSDEEIRELNIPGSMEEDQEPTEVVIRRARRRTGGEPSLALTAALDEIDLLVDALRLEQQRRDDEVEALRVHEATLEKEVQSLLTYQRQLQEDYDVVHNMLEESQQLRKDFEEMDPVLMKEEFAEREATLLRQLKEAKCLADEREEDLYVIREEKERLEAGLAEAQAEVSNQRDAVARLSDQLAETESARRGEEEPQPAPAPAPGSGEHDSGFSTSVLLPSTPAALAARENGPVESEESERWRVAAEESGREVERLRADLESSTGEVRVLSERLAQVEAARDRAQLEAGIERSERERLDSEKERLQRDLSSAQQEVNCQRVRLHALLHGAEDDLEDAMSSLPSSFSPRSPDEECELRLSGDGNDEIEEEILRATRARHSATANADFGGDAGQLPRQLQALLDRIHKEGVQLLSLSELQYLQTHATVIRARLDAVRRESGLPGADAEHEPVRPDPRLGDLQTAWRQEKEALQAANAALKDLLAQLSQSNGLVPGLVQADGPRNRNNNSVSPPPAGAGQGVDWRAGMLAAVERAYREERQALLAEMRAEVTAAMAAARPPSPGPSPGPRSPSPDARLRRLEARLVRAEAEQRAALERLYQADRRSLLEEGRALRRRVHAAEAALRQAEEQASAAAADDQGARRDAARRQADLAQQLERHQAAVGALRAELDAVGRRLADSEQHAEEMQRELDEREARIAVLAEQLQQEARRRQDCINDCKSIIKTLADEEQQLHDRLRTQLDSERSRTARLEAELKDERGRAIERARAAAVSEQDLRCQLEAAQRRVGDLEAGVEAERLRAAALGREAEAERALRRTQDGEAEARAAELGARLEAERARAEELRLAGERERRLLRTARQALDEERAGRRAAAHAEADVAAGLAAQLEAARARLHQAQAALDAERARARQLEPRADEAAKALERERAAAARLQAELGQARTARMEAETRADRLAECLRGLADEHEAERRRWREQERRCSLELERVSSRLHHSADLASLSSSRLTSTLRSSADAALPDRRQEAAAPPPPAVNGHTGLGVVGGSPGPADLVAAASGAVTALVAAENQVDVLRCGEAPSGLGAGLEALGRQLRAARLRLESASGASAVSGGAEAVVRQNCDLSRAVVRLAREKEELRAALCRLEAEAGWAPPAALRVPPDGRGPHGNGVGHEAAPSPPPPPASGPVPAPAAEAQRVYAKYLRSESKRRALVYQKRYLLLLLGGFRECEEAVLAAIAAMGVRLGDGGPRFRLPRPLMRFRAAARAVVATLRMRAMSQRWAALDERPASACSEGAPPKPAARTRGHSPFLTPPTRDAEPSGRHSALPPGLSPIPSSASSRPHSSPNLAALGAGLRSPPRWAGSPASPLPAGGRNEEFLRRLERLQRRVDSFSSPVPAHTPAWAARLGHGLGRADGDDCASPALAKLSNGALHRYPSAR